jgi:hypothetical protein
MEGLKATWTHASFPGWYVILEPGMDDLFVRRSRDNAWWVKRNGEDIDTAVERAFQSIAQFTGKEVAVRVS